MPAFALRKLGVLGPHAAYEIGEVARAFLRSNFIDVNLQHSVSKREARPRDQVDVVVAGFPCQPFSILGRQEGWSDSLGRGNLVEDTVAFIIGVAVSGNFGRCRRFC